MSKSIRPGPTRHAPGQVDLFTGDTGPAGAPRWVPPADYPRLPAGPVAVDLETRERALKTLGPGWALPDGGGIVGVAVATADWQGYFPIRHAGGGNLPSEHVLGWLRDELARPDVEPIFHNALFDMGWLETEGIRPAGAVHDTQIIGTLLNENRRSYRLTALTKDYLGREKDEVWLNRWAQVWGVNPKEGLWRLPARAVGPYAETDARLTYDLFQATHPLLAAEALGTVYQLERDLLPVLIAMRRRGIPVDTAGVEQLWNRAHREEADALGAFHALTGKHLEPWNADTIAKAYDARGETYPRTTTGAPSFVQEWLKDRAKHGDEVARLVLVARKWNKIRTTFVEGHFQGHVQANGRLYPQFHPLRSDDGGAVTGRFSSSAPNFQQLPAKDDELARMVRGLVLPEPGARWGAADYSQQEPRMLVHFAALLGLPGAADVRRRYHEDPTTDFHNIVVELAGVTRSRAKVLNLAQFYGQGGASLCHDLGLPTKWVPGRRGDLVEVPGDEGQAIIDQYHARVPFVRRLSDRLKELAGTRGWIRTIAGRRRRFEPHTPGGAFPHKALNALIQGSSADQTKMAMIETHRAGLTLMATVHDEIGFSVGDDAEAARICEVMETCLSLEVPSKVDLALGATWGDAL